MKMQTFIVKIGDFLSSIKCAFLEAFAENLFSGSVNCSGSLSGFEPTSLSQMNFRVFLRDSA